MSAKTFEKWWNEGPPDESESWGELCVRNLTRQNESLSKRLEHIEDIIGWMRTVYEAGVAETPR